MAAAAADPGISSGRYGSWGFEWRLGKGVTMVMAADGAPQVLCAQVEGRKVGRAPGAFVWSGECGVSESGVGSIGWLGW